MHKIKKIEPGSIAQELGLEPGDILLSINKQKITDILDYRFMIQEENLVLEIEKQLGINGGQAEIWELDIEKEEFEDLGMIFESDLMDKPRSCANRCIFCFMDQLPKGMRPSLYFKDDDPRLSFLSGNYVTLTNLDKAEAERIARYHLSPLHISVHAAEPSLRRMMLNNPASDMLFGHLLRFREAGISMHFQIVLCKSVNDGSALDESIRALLALGECAVSLSVVPVGITKFRKGLYPLQNFSNEDALAVIAQVKKWQSLAKKQRDNSFVYCADEWYIKAGQAMPDYDHYEDFPQLENGVGMWSLFEREFSQAAHSHAIKKSPSGNIIGIVTGEAAQGLMRKLAATIPLQTKIYSIKNNYFGSSITVSGLLTGLDIIKQIGEKAKHDDCKALFLPGSMFRDGSEHTLDDMSREEIEQKLGIKTLIGDTKGENFFIQLKAFSENPCPKFQPGLYHETPGSKAVKT